MGTSTRVLNMKWWQVILLLAGAALATWANIYASRADRLYYGGFGIEGNISNGVIVVLMVIWIGYTFSLCLTSKRPDRVKNMLGCLVIWLLSPAIFALRLWDEDSTARDMFLSAWYWTLRPLPLDIAEITGLRPPDNAGAGSLADLSFILLQLGTLALLVTSVGLLLIESRERFDRRLRVN
jgi:hypothetical protein